MEGGGQVGDVLHQLVVLLVRRVLADLVHAAQPVRGLVQLQETTFDGVNFTGYKEGSLHKATDNGRFALILFKKNYMSADEVYLICSVQCQINFKPHDKQVNNKINLEGLKIAMFRNSKFPLFK